ncbi:MAG TPA: GUN4 domain-containing protein [Trichocoleus sp.]|jgi:hypothetical protein
MTNISRYFQILEVEQGVSQEEIKQAYRDLAKVWHPDRFSDDPRLQKKAEGKLKQINAAYEFLKSYQPQSTQAKTQSTHEQPAQQGRSRATTERPVEITVDCERLKNLLNLGKWKEADVETTSLLLGIAHRQREGWLRPEDVKFLPYQDLILIDHLWLEKSNGRFGFSAQKQIWHKLSCKSSMSISTQTISEKRFGQAVQWHTASSWLLKWDNFSHSTQLPQGSLPRDYIFAMSGWWNYSKGATGYLIWNFDNLFLKL